MEINGAVNESFLNVVSEYVPMVPHWEIGTVNNDSDVAVPSDKNSQNKDADNNTFYKCTLCDYGTKKR